MLWAKKEHTQLPKPRISAPKLIKVSIKSIERDNFRTFNLKINDFCKDYKPNDQL